MSNFIILAELLILIITVIYFIVFFIYTFFYHILPLIMGGAFFAATDDQSCQNIIKLAEIKPNDLVVDLGSGDGKLVIAVAKAGAIAYGYEINPFLVWISRYKIKKAGLQNKAFVIYKDFWQENLSKYDTIVMFQLSFVMKGLEKKLKNEAGPNTKIIAKYFTFPSLKPVKELGMVKLYKI